MDKLKRYVECYIPVTTCNLKATTDTLLSRKSGKNEIVPIGHMMS